MKNIFAFLLLAAGSQAFAVTEVHEVAYSSATYGRVAVATSAATQVDSSAPDGVLNGRFVVSVVNEDATRNIFCGFTSDVSTIVTNSRVGAQVQAGQTLTLQINSAIPLHCRADSAANATLNCSVLQLR